MGTGPGLGWPALWFCFLSGHNVDVCPWVTVGTTLLLPRFTSANLSIQMGDGGWGWHVALPHPTFSAQTENCMNSQLKPGLSLLWVHHKPQPKTTSGCTAGSPDTERFREKNT